MTGLLQSPAFWHVAALPLAGAAAGWIAGRLSLRMAFRGVRREAPRWAGELHDGVLGDLVAPHELFEALDPASLSRHATAVLDRRLVAYTEEVMFYSHPRVWPLVPALGRELVYQRVREAMPRVIHGLVGEAADRADELVDLRAMLVASATADPGFVERLLGDPRLARVAGPLGLAAGALCGLAAAALAPWLPGPFLLPAAAALAGLLAGPLAMLALRRPATVHRLGPWPAQGLLHRARAVLEARWAALLASEVWNAQHLVYAMVHGPRGERVKCMVREHVQPVVDEVLDAYAPVAGIAVGGESIASIKSNMLAKAVAVSTDPFDHWPFNRDRARGVTALLAERLAALPPDRFERLFAPLFVQRRGARLLAGAALGAALGGAAALVLHLVFGLA